VVAVEPRIQYAQTKDGVNIAFWTMGEGMPLVFMPWMPLGNIRLLGEAPDNWRARLAKNRMVVAYDNRGSGLSDREVTDQSLEAHLLDLEAVVERLNLSGFALWGFGESAPVAIAYTARNPERVSHLILWCGWASASDVWQGSRFSALRAISESGDWTLYTETVASLAGWATREQVQQGAAALREMVTQEVVTAFWKAAREFDVTQVLPDVKSPTLVLQPSRVSWFPVDIGRRLASRIPQARLAIVDTDVPLPWLAGTGESLLSAVDEFLADGEEAPAAPELPEGMAVLLFADIAESTALTEQLGDAAFRAKARELDASLRSVISESGGTPVEGKVLGDGVLAVLTSARQAIDCALRCEAAGEPLGLKLHLGIHAGDVIREGNNVYGGAVNIAARIAAASAPGEVLVSQTVRDLARTSAGVTFDDRGQRKLKGVEGRQRLFAVGGGAGD
jgi:class 3 adenylate cyclase